MSTAITASDESMQWMTPEQWAALERLPGSIKSVVAEAEWVIRSRVRVFRSRGRPLVSGSAIAVPVAIYLLSLWGLYWRSYETPRQWLEVPIVALLVLAAPLTRAPVIFIGVLLVVVVAAKASSRPRGPDV